MQKFTQFLIAALFFLSIIFSAFSVTADISGYNRIINTIISGEVISHGSIVTTNENVYTNTLTINALTSVNAYGGFTQGGGNVTANMVIISGSAMMVYGGYSRGTGIVEENIVVIKSGGTGTWIAYGGYNGYGSGDVLGNSLTIEVGGTGRLIYGGYSGGSGTVKNNKVIIEGQATNEVYGGCSYSTITAGDVIENKVIINGKASLNVYGGLANGGSIVTDNAVTVNSSGLVGGNVSGGMSNGTGYVTGNIVEISGTVDSDVYGGNSSGSGYVTDNGVVIYSSGEVLNDVYGGIIKNTSSTAKVSSNTITIGGKVSNNVYGGWTSGTGSVTQNTVIVSGEVGFVIYGGFASGDAAVIGNSIKIESGGNAYNDVVGGYNVDGDVIGNKIEVMGDVYGTAIGGKSDGNGNITGNSVEVSGNASMLIGGYTTGDGSVSGNSVKTSSWAHLIQGGASGGIGDVTGNSVEVSGDVDIVNAGFGHNGVVANNTATISGIIYMEVYGGYCTGSGNVINNTVNITSTAILTTASLYGFNPGATGSGNTLNVDRFSGSMNTMGNFDTYNFVLGQLDSTKTFITITGAAVDIDGATINISFTPTFFQDNSIASFDIITVISSIASVINTPTININSSPFLNYQFSVFYNYGALELIPNRVLFSGVTLQSQTSFVGEGFAAGLAFLGQGADLRSDLYFAPQGSRFVPFAKMVYGKQHISTGSSVNVKGFSAIAGLALNTNFDNGSQLVVGAFVEGGWGNYDSRNSFSNSTSVKGKGDTEYYGGGLLARYAMASGLYGEGTFAAGKTETDFKTRDFTPGTTSKYDYSVPYYSANLTVGQVLSLNHMLDLDVYGKYLWTHQAGDNVTLDGYRFKFKDADSHRLRVGGKLQADVSPQLQPYVGAAYEYEFSGKIKGSLYVMNLDEPSLRGSTGIGELGLVWTPTESGNLKVDLGVQGYIGKREGVSGGLTVSLSF